MGGEYTEGLIAKLYIWFFFLLLIGIATATTFICYKKGWFKDDETFYLGYRLFWLFIAYLPVLILLLRLCCGSDTLFFFEEKSDYMNIEVIDSFGGTNYRAPTYRSYWYKTILWMLLILTAALGPAIRQNRSELGLDGIILFLADCCALLYVLFYFCLSTDDTALLLACSIAVILFIFFITLTLVSLKQLKRGIKAMLFYFAVGVAVFGPLLFFWTLYRLSYG